MATTRAVIYPRVSSVKQEDGVSLTDQEKDCRAYCAKQGYDVVAVVPETYSGYDSLDVRPGLQRVRDMFQRGEATMLVVWRYDRVARDMTDALLLHRELAKAGGQLESATEGPIENTPVGKVMLALRGFASETERDAIIARTHGALRTRAESGKLLIGRGPKIGYRYVGMRKDTYDIDEETAPIVRRIFDMAYQGLSLHAITKQINNDGVPTATRILSERGYPVKKVAATWTRQMVYLLLTDPAYKGQHVVYKRQQVKRRVQDAQGRTYIRRTATLRAEDDAKRLVQAIPAIVTPEIWESVQHNLKERSLRNVKVGAVPDNTILRGFAYCGHCGGKLTTSKHSSNNYRLYVCSHRRSNSNSSSILCSGGNWGIKADLVDEDVWAKAVEMGGDTVHLRRMLDARQEKIRSHRDNDERDAATIDAEIAECKRQQETLQKRLGIETDDFMYASLRQQLLRVRDTLKQLEERKARLPERQQQYAAWLAEIEEVSKLLDLNTDSRQAGRIHAVFPLRDLPKEEKRKVLRALGVRVYVYNTKHEYALTHDTRWEFTVTPSRAMESIQPRM